MIPAPPENKALKGTQSISILPPKPPATSPADLAKLQAELDAAPKPSEPPPGPRQIGHGSCPRCGAEGPIFVDSSGPDRKVIHGGCVCRKKLAGR